MFDRSKVSTAVVLDDSSLRFSASHFLTFPVVEDGEEPRWIAEHMHGHDFRASVKIEGPLDRTACVVDFIAASRVLGEILREWNGAYVLARGVRGAGYVETGDQTTIFFDGPPRSRYSVPTESARWIDGPNASAEAIALEILEQFAERLVSERVLTRAPEDYKLTLRLEEAPGCSVELTY